MTTSCHHCEPSAHTKSSQKLGFQTLLSFLCAAFVWAVMGRKSLSPLYQMIPTILSLFFCGWPLLKKGFVSFKENKLNMFSLISVGLLASFSLSLWEQEGLYYEGTATLVFFVLLGQWIENQVTQRSQNAIESLLSLVPKTALKQFPDRLEKPVSISSLEVGDSVRILPGSQIPLDGVILEGSSSVAEALFTGEPIPVEKAKGDRVLAGTLNEKGTFIFRVEKKSHETQLAQVIRFVEKLKKEKAPIQRQADKVAAVFTPIVFLLAGLTWLAWGFLASESGWVQGGIQAVSVLMIACPCALGLATPVALWVGTSILVRKGILIRNLEAIEKFEKMDALVFDKTGTVTQGKPQIVSWTCLSPEFSKNKALQWAASLESVSEHPLSQAFIEKAKFEGIDLLPVQNFHSETGKGIEGRVEERDFRLGSFSYIREAIGEKEAVHLFGKSWGDTTTVGLANNEKGFASFSVQDEIRPDAPRVIERLQKSGLHLVLASGDQKNVTEVTAKSLGISNFEGELSPLQKAERVKALQKEGRKVIFVGDGMNDAPALSQADLGIAMGSGSDLAKQSADLTLVGGDLKSIERAQTASQSMMKIIRQNLFWAFSYNALGIPLAMGFFMPLWQIKLSPLFASLAMTLSSLLVVGNSLRLFRLNYRDAK